MTENSGPLQSLGDLSAPQWRRLLAEHLTRQKLGLFWEASAIACDQAFNAHLVLPRLAPALSQNLDATARSPNLVTEGDNFDALRLLRSTPAGQVRVIYIDPPHHNGNKDWGR